MRRLAIALGLLLAPSGCIFLTPPTGLRLGNHSGEFAAVQPGEVGASQVTFHGFAAADFTLMAPTYWTTVVPPQEKNGVISAYVGVQADLAQTEGITITEIPLKPGSDPAKAEIELQATVKSNLSGDPSLKSAAVTSESADTLGRVPAHRLELRVSDQTGNVAREIAFSAIHGGKAFILVISTPERRYETFLPVFDSVFHQFAFNPPVCPTGSAPPTVPGASSVPGASAPPCVPANASAAPSAGPSGLAPTAPPPSPGP